jgi:hypothetical protein
MREFLRGHVTLDTLPSCFDIGNLLSVFSSRNGRSVRIALMAREYTYEISKINSQINLAGLPWILVQVPALALSTAGRMLSTVA